MAQRVGRGIALLFNDRGTRRGWVVSSTPRPHFTPGKDPALILQEAGWAPGPVWTGGNSRPHRNSIPDRTARSAVARRTELPGPQTHTLGFKSYMLLVLVIFVKKALSTSIWSGNSRSAFQNYQGITHGCCLRSVMRFGVTSHSETKVIIFSPHRNDAQS